MRKALPFAPLRSAILAAALALAPLGATAQTPPAQTPPPAQKKPAAAQPAPTQTPPGPTSPPAQNKPVGQPEEDDPAFSRTPTAPPPAKPPANPPPEEDPFPQPLPPEEEDPGFVATPAPRPGLALRRRAPEPPRGMRLRVSYRLFSLDEGTVDTTNRTDLFHALGFDIYPISGPFRLGLGAQIARETTDGDTFGTVSLAAGIQRPGRPWTPFGEAHVQAGLGERTFCTYFTEVYGCKDLLTMLWGFGVEGGVDGRLFGRTFGTAAIGFQRNQYFSVEVQDIDGELTVFSDYTFTLKLGIGY